MSNLPLVDARSDRIERRLEPWVLIATLAVIPILVIEESSYGEPWDTLGTALNWASWLVFVAEAAVMLSVVPDRRRWLREHPIDVAVVLLTPPFLTALAPLRLLRLLRLVRLLRLAPLARRLFSAEGLQYATILAALTVVVGGAAYAELEPDTSSAEGIYWAITTITTVGYGDLSPTTTEGRFLAAVVMLVGIGFVAILTGAIAERFLARELERETRDVEGDVQSAAAEVTRRLDSMRAQLDELEAIVARRLEARTTRKAP